MTKTDPPDVNGNIAAEQQSLLDRGKKSLINRNLSQISYSGFSREASTECLELEDVNENGDIFPRESIIDLMDDELTINVKLAAIDTMTDLADSSSKIQTNV